MADVPTRVEEARIIIAAPWRATIRVATTSGLFVTRTSLVEGIGHPIPRVILLKGRSSECLMYIPGTSSSALCQLDLRSQTRYGPKVNQVLSYPMPCFSPGGPEIIPRAC
jgi:hypothetical protein